MLDITGAEHVEVRIRRDGAVLWVDALNTGGMHIGAETMGDLGQGTALRICRIENLNVVDERDRPHGDRLRMEFTKNQARDIYWALSALAQLPAATQTEKQEAELLRHIMEHEGTAQWGRGWSDAVD